jgi:Domain of unknown function (DUF4274)
MIDYLRRSAELRPLMTRAQYSEIFPRDRWAEHGGGTNFGVSVDYGPSAQTIPDEIGRENIVERINFEAPFPTAIYGFVIGMSWAEAEDAIAALGLAALETARPDYRYFTGRLADGFELTLRFRADALEQVTLAQPDHSEITEARVRYRKEQYELEKQRREIANSWKLITDDDDAMLLTWAKHCKPWSNSEPSEFMRYADWLRRADPDQRHAAALTWNWDYGLAPLLWISRREDCDLATALHIFFGGEPSYYFKIGGERSLVVQGHGDLMTFDMMMDIKDRIERGFYTRSAIAFDLSQSFEILDRHKPTAEQLAAIIPADLPRRKEGRRIAYENRFDGVDMPAFRIN